MKNKRCNSNVPSGVSVSQPHQPVSSMNHSSSVNNHKQTLQNSHVGILNAKHLQNQTCKGNRKNRDVSSSSPSNSTENESSLLMKKLFEATQRQQQQQQQHHQQNYHQQQRNNVQINHKSKSHSTSNSPKKNSNAFKTLLTADIYAGAAFDRAPSGTSFPIPSFAAKSAVAMSNEGSMMSASCPLPNGPMTERILQESTSVRTFQENNSGSIGFGLKSLSINDLFQKQSDQTNTVPNSTTPSPPIKSISFMLSERSGSSNSNLKVKGREQESAEILTQNLRKILNLTDKSK